MKPKLIQKIEDLIGNGINLKAAPPYPDSVTGVMTIKREGDKIISKYALENGELVGLNLAGNDLTDSQLQQVLEFIDTDKLQALNLSENNLSNLTFYRPYSNLTQLEICRNSSLKTISFNTALPNLQRLVITNNGLEKLQLSSRLDVLRFLDGSRNALREIQFGRYMPELEYMDWSENRLENFTIPVIYPKMQYLFLKGSEPRNIPKEIYTDRNNCWEGIKNYFRASLQSGYVINNEAKFIFFGNGRAGKTTLSYQLRNGEFDETIEYTHGILVNEWQIERQDYPDTFLDKLHEEVKAHQADKGDQLAMPNDILLNVWDFGGQEYFHATHRLFMNDNVFYIIVWEDETNKQDEEKGDYPLEYWEKNIDHYSNDKIVLFAQNKERGNAKINHKELRYKIADRKFTSQSISSYDLDITTLKAGILAQLPKLNFLGVPVAKIYHDIRQEVKRRRKKDPYLTFQQFRELCQEMDKTEEQIMQNEDDVQSVVQFLHDTGTIICYRFRDGHDGKEINPALKDYVFMDPQWVTATIYQILDKGIKANNGGFDKKHVIGVLRQHNNVIQHSDLWIDLMCEFELIFEKKQATNNYIAPQFLSEKCQDLSEKAQQNFLIELPFQTILSYPDFLPRSIMSRFICRYGNLAKDYYWKYGIVVHKDAEKAMVKCDYPNQRIIIHTSVYASELATELLATLRKLDNSKQLELLVSDPDKPASLIGPVNIQKLEQQLAKEGRTYVEWNNQEFLLESFNQVLGSGEMGIYGRPMMKKSREQVGETTPEENNARISQEIYFSYAWKDEKNPEREGLVNEIYNTLSTSGFKVMRDKENSGYGESIDGFMKDMGKGALIIVFLSEKYLRSIYCMKELLFIAKNENFKTEEFRMKILPVMVEPINFADLDFRANLNRYWIKEKNKNQRYIDEFEKEGILGDKEKRKLRQTIEITSELSELLTSLENINRGDIGLYEEQDFTIIKNKIKERLRHHPGFGNTEIMQSLLQEISTLNQKLTQLK